MVLDHLGLPKDNGASDWADSARLAGLLSLVDPEFPAYRCQAYVAWDDDSCQVVARRHPISTDNGANNWKNFTRDQLMCLAAGLYKADKKYSTDLLYHAARKRWYRAQNIESDVPGTLKKFPNGADLLTPSHMGHLRRGSGVDATELQDLWLKADIIAHNMLTPLAESNQLICMVVMAGPEFVRLFKQNKQWKEAIRLYWCGWRNEPELAEKIINYLESI